MIILHRLLIDLYFIMDAQKEMLNSTIGTVTEFIFIKEFMDILTFLGMLNNAVNPNDEFNETEFNKQKVGEFIDKMLNGLDCKSFVNKYYQEQPTFIIEQFALLGYT